MFERYNEQARRALFFSRAEASRFGCRSIEPEHLLLGLLGEHRGVTARILTGAGTTPESLRAAVINSCRQGERFPTAVEIPFTEPTKMVLNFGAAEADALGDDHIGPEHLLLGLLREERSDAARLLATHGVRFRDARQTIERWVPEKTDAHPQRIAALERIDRIRLALVHLDASQGEASSAARSFTIREIEAELDSLTRQLRDLL
jgi:ATP-dependent Clp protease ATP-binding subunit ClpC